MSSGASRGNNLPEIYPASASPSGNVNPQPADQSAGDNGNALAASLQRLSMLPPMSSSPMQIESSSSSMSSSSLSSMSSSSSSSMSSSSSSSSDSKSVESKSAPPAAAPSFANRPALPTFQNTPAIVLPDVFEQCVICRSLTYSPYGDGYSCKECLGCKICRSCGDTMLATARLNGVASQCPICRKENFAEQHKVAEADALIDEKMVETLKIAHIDLLNQLPPELSTTPIGLTNLKRKLAKFQAAVAEVYTWRDEHPDDPSADANIEFAELQLTRAAAVLKPQIDTLAKYLDISKQLTVIDKRMKQVDRNTERHTTYNRRIKGVKQIASVSQAAKNKAWLDDDDYDMTAVSSGRSPAQRQAPPAAQRQAPPAAQRQAPAAQRPRGRPSRAQRAQLAIAQQGLYGVPFFNAALNQWVPGTYRDEDQDMTD